MFVSVQGPCCSDPIGPDIACDTGPVGSASLQAMTREGVSRPRKVGRPADSDPAETRRAILDVARQLFALRGFAGTTNRMVAARAGVTAGAIHHHFGSKLELYAAVHEDVQERVFTRFEAAISGCDTFRSSIGAVMASAHEMNVEDHTLAQFVAAVRIDSCRHPDMREAIATPVAQRDDFFSRLVDLGVTTGEIDPADRELANVLVITLMVGLTDAVSSSPQRHRLAVEGLGRLFDGGIIGPATHTSVQPPSTTRV